jgi:glycosyltransferase involved in cell wall biosynthesis
MRVLFHVFIPAEPRAAGVQQSLRVAYYLARVGAVVSVHIGTWYFKDKQHLLDFFGFDDLENFRVFFYRSPLQSFQQGRLAAGWGVLFHLFRFFKLLLTSEKKRYDVFFARGHRFPALHVLFRRFLGYKVVFEFHEILYLQNLPESKLLAAGKRLDFERFTYQKADGVIAISRTLKDLAEKKWGPVPLATVIPSGGILFESQPLPGDKPLEKIFFVGNFYLYNGLDYVIQALPEIPAATLTVVGGGGKGGADAQRVQNLVERLGLQERVQFMGFVEPRRLHQVYAEADLLVMAHTDHIRAKYFVSPLKLFEYMSARRPIIASDFATIREILCHQRNAWLVPPQDASAIAAAVRTLMADPAMARRLAEQAYQDVQQYAMDNKCAAIKSFLERVVA